ncbi:MAG: zinc-ribbon domain-containing protein [Desulfobulbaceae bacterium]|nr:zinc-ribbon domain-containing protein [Desulfobulbaceae bacterium]
MIITCEKCNARYDLDVSSIRKPSFKVRCAQCNHGFTVHKPAEPETDISLSEAVRPDHDHLVVSISNQKGGVAKTSTCMNLGLSLSKLGKKVLLIDFDVQANLTTSLDLSPNLPSFFDVLNSGIENISRHIHETSIPDLNILPANSRMALLGKQYMHTPNFEFMLRDSLKWVNNSFDYILIDTPPAIGYCTLNALMASDHVIIPTPCEYLSMHGIHKIEEIIRIVKRRTGSNIDYTILIAMHDPRSVASRVIFKKIGDMFKDKVFKTTIELDEKIKESQILHQPVHIYDPKSSSARQYMELAQEFLDRTS